ncbi:FIG003603: membrane protein, putative [hydrothermal vent metagenome]|uniref:FIG003603: membrane protein, putative n=1 Tax=hydrothermal vent metagenome TaxID=652676 RepID=A0A3B0RLX9_9ZZZZ
MMAGSLSFVHPFLLAGLLALPVFWLILSALPPEPVLRLFPPLRLLRDLRDETAIPQKIPLWLRLLRLAMIVLAILALAEPILLPASTDKTDRNILIVVDDGWANAADWAQIRQNAIGLASAHDLAKQQIALVFSASPAAEMDLVRFQPFGKIRNQLNQHAALPYAPDHQALARRLNNPQTRLALGKDLRIFWLSDGLDYAGASSLMAQLQQMGELHILQDLAKTPLRITGVKPDRQGLLIALERQLSDKTSTGAVLAEDGGGKVLGRQSFEIKAGERTASIALSLPLELRNRMQLVRVEGVISAAAVHLLDSSWARPRIGIVGSRQSGGDRPLLSESFYLTKALEPFGEVETLDMMATRQRPLPPIIVLLDTGKLSKQIYAGLSQYVQNGGFLIRFAGPRLAERQDDLIPVPLRSGGRLLGSALGWNQPQQLAVFEDTSPFFGLDHSQKINVKRQVLADSVPGLANFVWARLQDGTPLVTSAPRGNGRIVLFHVSASPDWSELPLSGVFVDMLKRLLPLAARPASGLSSQQNPASRFDLQWALDAKGRLRSPDGSQQILELAKDTGPVSPVHPAGLWHNPKRSLARNVLDNLPITDFPAVPDGVFLDQRDKIPPLRLNGWLIGLVLGLLVLDSLAILWLSGKFTWRGKVSNAVRTGLLLAVCILATPLLEPATASEADAFAAIEQTRLGYVSTGNAQTDAMSRAGIKGLSRTLFMRTTVEPGEPLAIDLETDDLNVILFLYWPLLHEVELSEQAANKINAYLKNGGMLILDTQDGGLRARVAGGVDPALASLFSQIDIPGLRQVPTDHVLTRTYYLIKSFAGRYANAPVWVEADRKGSSLDGVSSLVIGANDWAAAWAIDDNGKPLAGVDNKIDNQREMARRFGVNLVMYVLAGNYKADQVHLPALLERLQQ